MMKKRILCLIFVLLLLAGTVSANAPHPPRLVDEADLLAPAEETVLTRKLDDLSAARDFDIAIVAVESIGATSMMEYADDYYDYNGYGMGEDKDGILLLIAYDGEWVDYYYTLTGSGIGIFSESRMDDLDDAFLPALRDRSFYDAFVAFAEESASIVGSRWSLSFGWLIVALVLGALLSFLIPMSVLKGQLKSVKARSAATEYVRQGSLRLTQNRDIFLYRNVVRIAKPKQSSGGRHTGSSGTSHSGRGGRV